MTEPVDLVSSIDVVDELVDIEVAMSAIRDSLSATGATSRIAPVTVELEGGSALRIVAGAAAGLAVVRFGAAGRHYKSAHLNTWAAVCDADSGELRGLVRYPFGGLRVAATLGVAAGALIDGPRRVAMIGSGNYAGRVLEALDASIGISELTVYSRTPEHASAFAARLHEQLDAPVRDCPTASEAIEPSELVVVGTNSREPVVDAETLGERVVLSYGLESELHESGFVEARQIVCTDRELEMIQSEQQLASLVDTAAVDQSAVVDLRSLLRDEAQAAQGGLRLVRDSGGGMTDAAIAGAILERWHARPTEAPSR